MKKGKIYNTIGGDVPAYSVTERLNQFEEYLEDNITEQNQYIEEHAIQGEKGESGITPLAQIMRITINSIADPLKNSRWVATSSSFNREPKVGESFIAHIENVNENNHNNYQVYARIVSLAPNIEFQLLYEPIILNGTSISSVTTISHTQEGDETVTNCRVTYDGNKEPTDFEVHAQNGTNGASLIGVTADPPTQTEDGYTETVLHFMAPDVDEPIAIKAKNGTGGGYVYYQHNITIVVGVPSSGTIVKLTIVNKSKTQLNTYNNLFEYLRDYYAGTPSINLVSSTASCSGFFKDSDTNGPIFGIGVSTAQGVIWVAYNDLKTSTNTNAIIDSGSSTGIFDNVYEFGETLT